MLKTDPIAEENSHFIQDVDFSHRIYKGLCFNMNHSLSGQNQFDLMIEAVERADRLGFRFAWVIDEYFHASTEVKLNPAILHSAISVVTSQIELRGECLAPARRDTIRTAEDWSIIDNLSNGRIGVLVPFDLEGSTFGGLFVEHINTLRGLWKGDTVKRINGVGTEVDLKIFPRPIQDELSIWVSLIDSACVGSFKKAGELGLNILTLYEEKNHQQWLSSIEHYKDAVASSNHTQGKITVMVDLEDEGNHLLELDENNHSTIREEEFLKFYDILKEGYSCINELAFKIDLSRGRDAVFRHFERLEKYINL